MITDSNGREVLLGYVSGQYEDDLQLDDATYEDDGSDVPEDELEYITNEYPEALYEAWYDRQISRAEAYFEGDR